MNIDVTLPSGAHEVVYIHDDFYRALMGILNGLEIESKARDLLHPPVEATK